MKKIFAGIGILVVVLSVSVYLYIENASLSYKKAFALMEEYAVKADPSKPAVIFIPGVMATELYRENSRRIWPPNFTTLSDDFAKSYLDVSGNSANLNIQAGSPLPAAYGALYEYLESKGHNVYFFGYDWRLDNRINAEKFGKFIESLPNEKVDIIAHSMGGLVTAQYLKTAVSTKVDKFIAVGTPFLGVIGAVKDLETGKFLGDGFTGKGTTAYFKRLFVNQSSWYQILPGAGFFRPLPDSDPPLVRNFYIEKTVKSSADGDKRGSTVEIAGYDATVEFLNSRPNINQKLLASGMDFTNELALTENLKKVDTYFIAGTDRPTISSINYVFQKRGNSEIFEKLLYKTSTEGDGTVLVDSATIGGKAQLLFDNHVYFFKELHGLMLTNRDILEKINEILDGSDKTYPNEMEGQ